MFQLRRRGRYLAVVGAAACAVAMSACSSGAGGGASSSAAAAAGSVSAAAADAGSPTGSPVTIMVIATRNNPGLSQANLFAAAQAETDAVNAAGGVDGHKLVLMQCDENLDPNLEKACVNQAVSAKVSAVVGSSLLFDQFDPLAAAHIPLLYNIGLTPKLFTDPISYPTPGIVGWFAGEAMLAGKDGIKAAKLGEVNQAASAAACTIAKTGLASLGIKVLGTVTSNLVAPDRTADAAALMQGSPQGILLCGDDIYNVAMIKALRQAGYQGRVYSQASGVLPGEAASLGSLGEGVRVSFDGEPSTNTANPIVAQMVTSVNKYVPGTVLDETAAAGWSGVYLFAHVMAKATAFTGQDVINTLNAIKTPVQGGVFGPFVGSGTSPYPQYPRLFYASFLPAQLQAGKLVPTGTFTVIPPAILNP